MARDKQVTVNKIVTAWNDIIHNNEYPSLSSFAKKAGVAASTLYHNYPDWANKVAERRDKKRGGERRRSPVTLPREKENLRQANEQIKLLMTELHASNKKLEKAESEIKEINIKLQNYEQLDKQNQFLLGGFYYLIEQLELRGATSQQIELIWNMFEKQILTVSEGKAHGKRENVTRINS